MTNKSIPLPAGFEALSKSEKVQYVQDLWDEIADHPEDVPVHEGHLEFIEERLRQFHENPDDVICAFEHLKELESELE